MGKFSSWARALPLATVFSPADTQVVVQADGVPRRMISGRLLSMYVQVDTSHNAYATDAVFRGVNQKKVGPANDSIIIRTEVLDPWANDSAFFYTRIPDLVTGLVGSFNVFAQVVTDRGTVADQTARLALSSAAVGDFCTQTAAPSGIYTLTTAGPGTNSNWTQNPVGTPGACTVLNPAATEPLPGVTMCCLKLGPNLWSIQA